MISEGKLIPVLRKKFGKLNQVEERFYSGGMSCIANLMSKPCRFLTAHEIRKMPNPTPKVAKSPPIFAGLMDAPPVVACRYPGLKVAAAMMRPPTKVIVPHATI